MFPIHRFPAALAAACLISLTPQSVSAQDSIAAAGTLAPAMQRQMADWLMVNQRSMIGLAQLGQQTAQRPEVRQLADIILNDHQMMMQQLEAYRPAGDRIDGAAEDAAQDRQDDRRDRADLRDDVRDRREAVRDARRDADGVRRPLENLADRVEDVGERIGEGARNLAEGAREAVDTVEDRVDDRYDRDASANSPWLQLHREIADQTGRDATAQLSRYRGNEAEEAFLGTVLAAHLQGRATMKVFSSHADAQLRPLIESALQKTQQHEMMAGRLMAQIKE